MFRKFCNFTSARRLMAGVLLAAGLLAGPVARADIMGFNNGVGWTANGGATFSGDSLTVTSNAGNQARSAFFNTSQSVGGGFTAQFTYTASGARAADGATFTIQNDPRGVKAVGGTGGSLGYSGITPSAAVAFNIFNGHTIGTNLFTNGVLTGGPDYINSSPVDPSSGHPIQVTLLYNGTSLSENMHDLTTDSMFNISYIVNLAQVLGSQDALVGFTGATGGAAATQTLSTFTYTAGAPIPEPGSLVLAGIGMISLLGYGYRRRNRAA